ncbi:hypothetical protein BDBG_16511 [Blastomyces gilchristii SLH14081]|uniref:Uncharacterized protein n=1 Tax=Blastomyces gilchristii (strain SLH14081) TaxID=559298 RepID=A0A179UHC2_BLAGS|nr:uncharacterized protein BDBG_16511 [Blastomyces gilchristii SLH14081]OAT05912.1 hypothetical protein BDBG_16511 [Blastomyces gilchristii SLH14081]
MLTEREGDITMMMRETEKELNTDKLISRRDNISLQDTVTITAVIREVEEEEEEEEDMTMRAALLQSVDTAISVFNQAFLTATEITAAL